MIPFEMCSLGWQESLNLPTHLVEPEIPDGGVKVVLWSGTSDVRAFGLTWDDCRRLLNDLGFDAEIRIEAAYGFITRAGGGRSICATSAGRSR